MVRKYTHTLWALENPQDLNAWLINLDIRGTNVSSGRFEKGIIFLSLFGGVGDMEDAAHLHLITGPAWHIQPRVCPRCQWLHPDNSQCDKPSAQLYIFSDLFPRNFEFHGTDSWSLDGFLIPPQVCLQRLVPEGFNVKSLPFLFSFGYFYFILGFMGNRKKLKIHSKKSEFMKVCSAHWVRARLGAGSCCLEDSNAAYCVNWETALLSLQDSSNQGMLKSMSWIPGYCYNVPQNTVFHGTNWQIS